jgi:hypothetical protein
MEKERNVGKRTNSMCRTKHLTVRKRDLRSNEKIYYHCVDALKLAKAMSAAALMSKNRAMQRSTSEMEGVCRKMEPQEPIERDKGFRSAGGDCT